MKLYKVEASSHGYDEYDSFIVWAKTPDEALKLVKAEVNWWDDEPEDINVNRRTNFDEGATITEIVKPKTSGILLGSFNAG